jgi:RNA polymerase sigma-70 factor (ECF subfamily)
MDGSIAPPMAAGAGDWESVPVAEAAPSLVDRLRRGEAAAVASAYDQHHAHVRSFAWRLVGDEAAAEDLVQEVFATLPSAIKRFRGESSLRSFLIAVAINHARHYVRAAARRRTAMERLAREPRAAGAGPDGNVSRRELAAALSRALDHLSIDQRVAFVLLEVEERTSAEAAALLGVAEVTVRTRLFHARQKLRARLAAEGYDDFE